ncbi:MAG: 2'-5' RNA ligase family protein [Deltaproteobacteria bacterium]|nr:2'-5' RNA ligase family protein [Deltaproteobacteria bacterium]
MSPSDRREAAPNGSTLADAPAPVVSYFVASFLPDHVAHRLFSLASCLGGDLVPQPAERMHLTYRSFDGLPHGRLDPLKHALAQVAERHAPLVATLRGAGAFPAGAIWARVRSRRVLALHADIDAAMESLGLPPAFHPFVPHVTLCTGPAGSPPPDCLDRLWMRVRLDAIALTTTGNAAYRTVRWFPLGRAEDEPEPGASPSA